MAKIYIVNGTTGKCSERSVWAIRAYSDESKAREHVENATREANRIFNETDEDGEPLRYSDNWENPYDPCTYMDYTGTSYFISEVELDG